MSGIRTIRFTIVRFVIIRYTYIFSIMFFYFLTRGIIIFILFYCNKCRTFYCSKIESCNCTYTWSTVRIKFVDFSNLIVLWRVGRVFLYCKTGRIRLRMLIRSSVSNFFRYYLKCEFWGVTWLLHSTISFERQDWKVGNVASRQTVFRAGERDVFLSGLCVIVIDNRDVDS